MPESETGLKLKPLAPQLIQLHWQNRANLEETIFVGQTEFTDPDVYSEWFHEIINRRRDECPEGWGPLVCNEGSPMFVMAAGVSA